nr:RNA-directed DNA polymerase, eukaryota, reverse transcriptase zinc-binding domain protein [Tanacetum cinerariifolium]
MGDRRLKEDGIHNISTSIFVTNFPDQTNAKELWRFSNQYGNVIDAFIPDRRSKIGKRYGFIRFIQVANVDRLINNLCTIWIGKFKLHANVARFNRLPLNNGIQHAAPTAKVRIPSVETFNRGGAHGTSNCIFKRLKLVLPPRLLWKNRNHLWFWIIPGSSSKAVVEESKPFMVLDHSCYNNCDSSLSLVGKLKEFGSLLKIKKILEEEGFVDITIRYMGGFWVLFQFISQGTKDSFKSHVGVNSWFSLLQQGSLLHEEEEDDSYFHRKRLCIKTSIGDNIFESFKIIVKGKTYWIRAKEVTGWAPKFSDNQDVSSDSDVSSEDINDDALSENGLSQKAKKDWVKELRHNNKVNFLTLQETKMEKDTNMFQKENVTVSDYFIAIMGKWLPSDRNLLIISVYAPQELSEKRMLWQYLNHIINGWKGDVIVMGDFNEVCFAEEIFGTIFNARGGTVFNSFITSEGLVEVPTGGYSFTWSHKSAAKMSKLDRFLVSEDLMSNCPNLSVVILDRYLSDHRPILLHEMCVDYGPYSFRLFNYWFELEGFDSYVADTWRSNNILESNAMLKLIKKLKLLKGCIRTWVHDKKERSQNLKKCLKNKLPDIDISLDKGEATSAMLDECLNIMNDLTSLENTVLLELAQKAKIKWAIEGDENSKFFHGIINKNRNNLAVRSIIADGEWTEEPNAVKNEFFSHFRDRFDRPCHISLIGSLYKIIVKLLANRIVAVMSDLVNEVQSAFIANRQILDGLFMLNEIIHWCKSKKKQTMIFKVDFEKAFDSVRWDFLDDVMANFGFASKEKGGLGVLSFYALNHALTFKWI